MDAIQEMKQVSVSELLKEHSLVVPEIQREYVWGRNDYDILTSFLEDIKDGYRNYKSEEDVISNPFKNLLDKATDEEKVAIRALIAKTKAESQTNDIMNIGFLYSYKPNYYISDEGKDAYLIDGQQRFTTILLVLHYLAIKEGKLEEFKQLYRFKEAESKIAFDYRVRTLTHNFIIDLISNTSSINDLQSVKNKRWFLSNYKKDTTIKSIVGDDMCKGAYAIIHEQLNNAPEGLFDFVKNNIKFWHFKTEETSQGEELYITMNSRGQQLADNETIRAVLFQTEEAKTDPLKWSELWEEWQDFFWKNRSKDASSADKGFNEFLACISGLENYLKGEKIFYSKEDFERFNQINSKNILNNITLPLIETYINSLKFIETNIENFSKDYGYSMWVNNCVSEIWRIFNKEYTNWYADYDDSNRATERNRMVFIWSFLYYSRDKNLNDTSIFEFFRLLRMFYLRYRNFIRSVKSIKPTIDLISINGVFDTLEHEIRGELDDSGKIISYDMEEETDGRTRTHEEILKYNFLNKYIDNISKQKQYEELIWEIEDHKFNLNGRDVGSQNICYLVDLEIEYTVLELKEIKDKLYQIFPEEKDEYLLIQNILLYYGEYWHRVSPWYYFNYKFDNWRRIIRDRDHENKHTRKTFRMFFYDFVNFKGSIEDFLEEKRKNKLSVEDCDTFGKKLCWYNQYISDKMWSEGNYIAISNGVDANALSDYSSFDKVFEDIRIIYNTKGNLRGGNPQKLFKLLPNDIKKQIKEDKPIDNDAN